MHTHSQTLHKGVQELPITANKLGVEFLINKTKVFSPVFTLLLEP